MFNDLINKRKHCKAKVKINQSFDYISMFTKLLLKFVTISKIHRRLRKSISMKKNKEIKKKVSSIKNSKNQKNR